MKRRVLAAATVLSLAVPSLLADTGLPLHGASALAQPAQSDPVTDAARAKFQEGVKAFEAGKYEDARSAFLQAYALKRSPAVLLNLGQSEIKSAHYEDGGNHLQQFIREHKTATPDQVTAAQGGIAEAKKKTGYIVIIVNAVGADLSVDGAGIGKSPLLDPYFVKPGKHVIYATHGGTAATTSVDVVKGIASSATITLAVTSPQPTAPLPTATAPVPTATAPVPTAPTATATATATFTPPPQYPYPTATTTAPYVPSATHDPLAPPTATATTTGPDLPPGAREPLFDWFRRKPIAWVGAGATVIGLGMGIGFSAAAAGASEDVNSYAQQIKAQGDKYGLTYPPCGKEDDPSDDSDVVAYTDSNGNKVNACETLRGALSQYRADVAVAAVGWVVFGLGAIGTVTYALIDWYPKKGRVGDGPRVTGFAPVIAPDQGGVTVAGEF